MYSTALSSGVADRLAQVSNEGALFVHRGEEKGPSPNNCPRFFSRRLRHALPRSLARAAVDPQTTPPPAKLPARIPAMAGMEAFEAYFRRADLNQDGRISGQEAIAFFQGANLPQQVLAQVRAANRRS
jgi:hypothetical protein